MATLLRITVSILLLSNAVLAQADADLSFYSDKAVVTKALSFDDNCNLADNDGDDLAVSFGYIETLDFGETYFPAPDRNSVIICISYYSSSNPRAPPLEL